MMYLYCLALKVTVTLTVVLIKLIWFRVWTYFARLDCKTVLLLKPITLYPCFVLFGQI